MKRLGSIVVALVLAFAMGVTAFAADSATVTSVPTSNNAAVVTEAIEDKTTVSTLVTNATTVAQTIASASAEAGSTVTTSVLRVFEITAGAGERVTFNLSEVSASDTIVVIHFTDSSDLSKYETISATAGTGKVTFTVPNSLSPFAIVKTTVTSPTAASTGSTASTESTASTASTTSPKTGDTIPVALAVVLIAGAGIVVLNRKKVA